MIEQQVLARGRVAVPGGEAAPEDRSPDRLRQTGSSTPSRRVARQPPQVGEQPLKVGEADPLAALGVLERRAPRAAWPLTPQPQQSGVIVGWGQLVRIGRLHRLHPHAIRWIMSATTSRCSYDGSIPADPHQTPTKQSPGLVIGVKFESKLVVIGVKFGLKNGTRDPSLRLRAEFTLSLAEGLRMTKHILFPNLVSAVPSVARATAHRPSIRALVR